MIQHLLQLTPENIPLAARLLKEERLVAIPTETVYGLAAISTSSAAVAQVYTLKNRPQFNPLICHVSCLEQAETYGVFTPLAQRLAKAFWPGPLTLVVRLKSTSSLSDLATAGLQTVGLRVPAYPLICQLIREVGAPLAAPSANPSEHISPTLAQHVVRAFGDNPHLPLILDGGACTVGIESTILDMTQDPPQLLRAGGLSLEDIQALIGPVLPAIEGTIKAPGQLKRHYAPSKPLRINVLHPLEKEGFLAFGPNHLPERKAPTLNLSPRGDLKEAACNLFSMLRALDDSAAPTLAVHPIPLKGLGLGINDRLLRASS